MDYDTLKNKIKAKLGNHWYISKGSLVCFAMAEKAKNTITAEILRFNNDSNTFSVKFTEMEKGKESTKEYNSIDDFIIDFKDIINLINKTERIYNNIFCK